MPAMREDRLHGFFKRYAAALLSGDVETVAGSYAEKYIETSPDAFVAWKVDGGLRKALAERDALMRDRLGLSAVDFYTAHICELAPYHDLAEIRWTMAFERAKAGRVCSEFTVSYVVRTIDEPVILAYICHESEEAVLRRDGVI